MRPAFCRIRSRSGGGVLLRPDPGGGAWFFRKTLGSAAISGRELGRPANSSDGWDPDRINPEDGVPASTARDVPNSGDTTIDDGPACTMETATQRSEPIHEMTFMQFPYTRDRTLGRAKIGS